MKKILFIQPSFSSLVTLQKIIDGRDPRDFSEAHYTFPIGLLHIASMLEKHNYDVRILDLDKKFYTFLHSESKNKDLTKFLEKYLVRFVSEYNPDIVGISGNFNINKSFVTECCKKLKEFDKELPIVLGGHYPTNCYEEILENDNNVDFIVLGEGEAVMLQLVNALDSGNVSNIERHPSIVVKNGNEQGGKIKKTSAKVGNLDGLPSINYDLLENVEMYISRPGNLRTIFDRKVANRAIAIMTSRGCPNRCIYCASHKVHGRKMRAFSVERIISELVDLVNRYDINALIIEDDLFTFSRKRTIRLCREIYERFADRFFIEFSNGIAVKTLDEESIFWLVKAGMKQIHLAIESGNQYVQDKVIKKKLDLAKVKPVVEILRKYDVIIRAFFIIGFPGESIDMMRDTKRFAKELKVDWAIFSFASPVVGSELYESAKENDQLISTDSDETTYFDSQLNCDEWTYEDVKSIQEEANYEVNFLENYNLVEGNFAKSTSIFSDICKTYPKHLIARYCLWKSQIGKGDLASAKCTEDSISELVMVDPDSKAILERYHLSNVRPFKDLSITQVSHPQITLRRQRK